MLTRIGKFVAGGGMGTLCHYVMLWIMVKHHFNPVASSGCGLIAGATVVYIINYYFTFSSSKKHFDAMKRFLPMVVLGFCVNGLILGLALECFALPLPLSQVMATAGQFLCGFTISLLWVF
ncbi:Putative flippase GtrA (transmembrane translocase of bactoprenol-linked glucose) [Desulfocicer vacuolatum DSM 3385]|uniref:Putative flippase GtrA (Transmembrane translocase of bactoprenol-linked glucose) n=1 Tax=Desulfocicer vacuolatum DSM 3385 TaxID=1121400 RepID=A0A1W2DKV1_9BACT|nr:GtrA family protein [Desulfocicer vacuolatum]SMC98051.1 Putative flippase GtrA (transmembrane translocase of bactoprenol-linked glucose) [Desulfocicer vacuolatum DSM 3385]